MLKPQLELFDDFSEEYQALVNSLRCKHGFGLHFVETAPNLFPEIIKEIKEDLLQQKVVELSLDKEASSLYSSVQKILADHRQVDILLIYGLEEAIFAYEDVKKLAGWSQDQIRNYSWEGVAPVLVNINQQRERFRDNLPIKFVFLVRHFTINYLIAPDFLIGVLAYLFLSATKILLNVKPNTSFKAATIASTANGIKAKELPKFARFKNYIDQENQPIDQKAQLYNQQGLISEADGDYTMAISSYDRAIAIKPDLHGAWYNRACWFAGDFGFSY